MRIEIKSLQLENFKGIKSLSVEFSQNTDILGDNGTGKSTIFDAFTWLLFGKDSHDSKDFNIKTLENGKAIEKIDHTVEGILNVDGAEVVLKRTYQEKWQRRRGSEETELTGHETLFYWNGVPEQAGTYKSKVDGLVNEGLFKLITSATAFNSMDWKKRREVLISIAGTIDDTQVIKSMTKAQAKTLTDILESGKPLADFRKEVAMKRTKLQNDIKLIPARIDEVKRGIHEPVDFESIKKDIYAKQMALLEIETALTDKVSAYEEQAKAVQAKRSEINALRSKLQQIEYKTKSDCQAQENEQKFKIDGLKQQGKLLVEQRNSNNNRIAYLQQTKTSEQQQIASLRTEWGKISEEVLVFDPDKFICPTCKQDLPAETITTRRDIMTADFEKDKTKRLADIQAKGKTLSESVKQIDTEVEECSITTTRLASEIEILADKVRELEANQITSVEILPIEHKQIEDQIAVMELSVLDTPPIDISGLKQQKGQIQQEIESLKYQLTTEEQIKKGNARVKELMSEEKTMAQQISELEKQEFAIEGYVRGRMDQVENQVNGKFSIVQFRMFNTLINGGTEESCECLIHGVPYADANSAAKIQGGLDIINTLSDHYGVYCPVFTDNAESVNKLPETKSQLIRLVVSNDKSLVIK